MSTRPLINVCGVAALIGLCAQVAGGSAPLASASASTPAPQVETVLAQAVSSSGSVRFDLDPSASYASYHAHEQLIGNTLPTEAVGTSTGVVGSIVLAGDGTIATDQSTFTVDLTQLKSDESRRDNFIKGETLQTSQFPTATFVANAVQDLPSPLPTSGTTTFELLGDLTVHGVTRPVTWQVNAQFTDAAVSGSATTRVNISDFGMTPPRAGPVLSIEDNLGLEIGFAANRAA